MVERERFGVPRIAAPPNSVPGASGGAEQQRDSVEQAFTSPLVSAPGAVPATMGRVLRLMTHDIQDVAHPARRAGVRVVVHLDDQPRNVTEGPRTPRRLLPSWSGLAGSDLVRCSDIPVAV